TTRKTEVQASSVMSAYPSAQHALLTASGYVVAQRRAAVSSKATGRLIELRVREGSPVKEGERIGRLDASDVLAAMQAAQAGQRQAEATLQQAEAGVRQAQVERANAEADLQRALELRAQGFVSPQAVDAARRRADAARAGEASAQAGIAAARGNIAAAAAQVQVQAVNRANTEIRAPFDGVVLVKNANVGDMITPFSSAAGAQGAVVTMADMGTLEVEADVSESNVGQITIEMPVEITLDALPEARFRGSVVRIVPTVDRAKATVMTKIRFEALDPRVLPEMSAKVVFLKQRPTEADFQPVLAVNPRTVVQRDGRPVVLRIGAGEVLEAVPVTPGRTLGDALEVAGDALKAGERLVLDPDDTLAAGARVTVAGK
ncbi:MAG TPA: efflux RND transporter periplasmic adaptor subunit, partial [Rubrivivax sp.]|nr:efflux RND transporter periplasmic adaptor subunit [Rubrivivax sp.]